MNRNKRTHIRMTADEKKVEKIAIRVVRDSSKAKPTVTDVHVAGLYHVARICARCEQVGDCPWRSEGYPYCTPCVERDESIKLDDYNN